DLGPDRCSTYEIAGVSPPRLVRGIERNPMCTREVVADDDMGVLLTVMQTVVPHRERGDAVGLMEMRAATKLPRFVRIEIEVDVRLQIGPGRAGDRVHSPTNLGIE